MLALSSLLAVNGAGPPGRSTCTFYVNHLKHSRKTLSNAYKYFEQSVLTQAICVDLLLFIYSSQPLTAA